MQPMTGQIKKSGKVIADGVRGMYEIEVKRDGSENWTGYFIVPAGVDVKIGDHVEIALADGRSKQIEVNRVNVAPTQTTVSFVTPL
jgi:hypothetical protein